MSLRSVHIFFIFVATVFTIYFGLWCFQAYRVSPQTADLVQGVLSMIISLALSIYFVWFIRKSRELVLTAVWAPVLFWVSLPEPAQACAVCFGDKSSPMGQSASAGVMFLLVIVCTVLSGIGGLLMVWIRRARRLGL